MLITDPKMAENMVREHIADIQRQAREDHLARSLRPARKRGHLRTALATFITTLTVLGTQVISKA
jgi:hypothetical protein